MGKKFLLFILLLLNFEAYASDRVPVLTVDAAISPATARYIDKAIGKAEEESAPAIVIKLNTPGGLLEATRDIVSRILDSKVPVLVYVAPSGSRAGSAGVFITLSGHVAAMAPGTNIGAAHPVGMQGEADSSVMFEKVTNDAAAFIRTIADRRKRNVSWAERTVRESISSTEKEALDSGAIDFVCVSVEELIAKADGKVVEVANRYVTLQLKGKATEDMEMSWIEELLLIISDPNIAYILLMLGIYGILFELFSPGAVLPGVLGSISMILGLYSMNTLPINYAGAALIILAVILFLLEIKVTSYGILTIGGVIALFLGSMMLIDSPLEFMQISLSAIITNAVLNILFFAFVIALVVKARKRRKVSGADELIGKAATVLVAIAKNGQGKVKVFGEIWNAVSDTPFQEGDRVKIESIKGLTLKVVKYP